MLEPTSPITTQGVAKAHQKQEKFHPHRSAPNLPRFGVIVDFTRELWVYVRFDDELSFKSQATYPDKAIPLGHTSDEVAVVYGDDIIGLRVRVEYSGARKKQGMAYIIRPSQKPDHEKSHKLPKIPVIDF